MRDDLALNKKMKWSKDGGRGKLLILDEFAAILEGLLLREAL